jgi:flagellar hook protein FlgE
LSGLNAASRGLDVAGNNIANSETVGFKSARPEFADVFAASLTGGGSNNIGIGTQLAAVTQQFTQGNIVVTNNPFDLAINGGGLFRMSNNGVITYSRAGQFQVDKDGYIADSALGFRLGVLGATGGLQTVSINGQRTNPPKPTSEIKFADNLSATATEHVISGVEIYDGNGGKHTWTIRFTNTFSTTAGRWAVTIEDEKGAKIKEGEIVFNGSAIVAEKGKITVDYAPAGATASKVVLDFGAGVTGGACC